jgi:hypothetical protein
MTDKGCNIIKETKDVVSAVYQKDGNEIILAFNRINQFER